MMRPNFMRKHEKKVLLSLIGVGMLLILYAFLLQAQTVAPAPAPVPWTAVGSTGVVDEASVGRYIFTGACVEIRPRNTLADSIELRYNVVNTFDNGTNPNSPGWTKLEIGFMAPAGSEVVAQLVQVKPCSGSEAVICAARGTNTPNFTCTTCQFSPSLIDFSGYLYYVDLKIRRTTPNARPRVCTLRVL